LGLLLLLGCGQPVLLLGLVVAVLLLAPARLRRGGS
jgi:hypothetical protein